LGCAPSPSRLVVKSSRRPCRRENGLPAPRDQEVFEINPTRHCRIRLSCDSRIDCGVIVVLTLGLSEDATLCHNPRPVATERTRESKGARAILMIATLYSPVTSSPSRGSGTKRNDLRLMASARGIQHSHLPNSADAAVRFSCQQGPRRCQPAPRVDQCPASNVDHGRMQQLPDPHREMPVRSWSDCGAG